MKWSIQQIARLAGTTSRTLRHYDDVGVAPPSRIGDNGYRYYDETALLRLQRVLLLRELGVGLPQVRRILSEQIDEASALGTHLALLRQELGRITRQITAVEQTIAALNEGEELMAETMFDGFDHTQYRDEVERRWGHDAYARSDSWWRSLSAEDRTEWMSRLHQLNRDWAEAATAGLAPDSTTAQELARRHLAWLRSVPGTPASRPDGDLDGYVRGLAELYLSDDRFAANYGGTDGARFVRDALIAVLDTERD